MFVSTSHFCLFQCQHVSLCSLPRSELIVGLAQHQNTLRVFPGILSSKSPRQKLVSWVCSTQPSSAHVTNQVSVTHQHIVEHLHVQMPNLSIQGKNSNSCKELPRNQNDFSSCQHQKSPAPSGATASIRLQSPVLSTHHHLHVPATYLCPQIINRVFWGDKNQPNYEKESPICI